MTDLKHLISGRADIPAVEDDGPAPEDRPLTVVLRSPDGSTLIWRTTGACLVADEEVGAIEYMLEHAEELMTDMVERLAREIERVESRGGGEVVSGD